jgi:hypothetical protein
VQLAQACTRRCAPSYVCGSCAHALVDAGRTRARCNPPKRGFRSACARMTAGTRRLSTRVRSVLRNERNRVRRAFGRPGRAPEVVVVGVLCAQGAEGLIVIAACAVCRPCRR